MCLDQLVIQVPSNWTLKFSIRSKTELDDYCAQKLQAENCASAIRTSTIIKYDMVRIIRGPLGRVGFFSVSMTIDY